MRSSQSYNQIQPNRYPIHSLVQSQSYTAIVSLGASIATHKVKPLVISLIQRIE